MRPRNQKSILVVDDESQVLDFMSELLTAAGFAVTTAADGAAAIELVQNEHFGVAIVDKNLPGGISGLDVLRRSRALKPAMRFILFTGFPSTDSAIAALRNGAFDYIEKPVDNDLLVEKVHHAWEAYLLELERDELFRKYESLFEIVPGIVWFMTEEGKIKRINKEGAAMLGYDPVELLEQPYELLLPKSDPRRESHWAFKERRTGNRATRAQVVEIRTKSGTTKLFEINSTGAYDRSAVDPNKSFWGTLGVGWDITSHALLEEQLQQACRLEAIGRLAGGIAHDFNNLLSVIINNADFLKQSLSRDEKLVPDVLEIERAADRAAQLTRQLLAFSRKQVISPKLVDLSGVVEGLERLLRRLISEDIQLVIEKDDKLSLVTADPGQMEQVIINLALNARDAMPNGGRLTIHTSNIYLDEHFAAAHIQVSPGPYVMLAVSDNGHGMSPEVRQHLFEPFYTTKQPGRGTGLGMATVYGIVTQANGHISVYSEAETGTSVKVYLPAVERQELPAPPAPPLEPALGRETVLVVEDEESLRRLARRILERHGYHVIEAENGQDAVDRCSTASGIHVLLTDMVMPKMAGAELAVRMRESNPSLRVVYMSGYVGNVATQHAMLTTGAAFLQKPFTGATLLSVIRRLLDEPLEAS